MQPIVSAGVRCHVRERATLALPATLGRHPPRPAAPLRAATARAAAAGAAAWAVAGRRLGARRRGRAIARTAKRRKTASATASAQPGGFPNPLDATTSDLEELIWESNELADLIGRAPKVDLDSAEDSWQYVWSIVNFTIQMYARLVISGQLTMLASTMAADPRLSVGLQRKPTSIALEEPFSWRPLSNHLGLHAFALDVFWWRAGMIKWSNKKGGPARAARGFAERGSGHELCVSDVQGFGSEDTKLYGDLLGLLLCGFKAMYGSGGESFAARVLLPKSSPGGCHLNPADLAWDVCEYSGDSPRSELLVTARHSVVIVVREADSSSPERGWQLCADSPGAEGEVGAAGLAAAPVVVLTLMQHGAELGDAVWSRVMDLLRPFADGDESRKYQPWALMVAGAEELPRAASADAALGLSRDVAPLLRESFTTSWAHIRERRMGELRRAKVQLGKLEKRRAALEVARGKLEESVSLLDREAFERLAAEAAAKKLVPRAQIDQLAERLANHLEKAEAPLRQLVASRCGQQKSDGGGSANPAEAAREATVSEMLEALEGELERTPLAPDSPWVNAAKSLQAALVAAERLRAAAAAAAADPGVGTGVAELAKAVAGCESAVSLLEAAARAASGDRSTRAPGLRRVVVEAREALGRARADEALREVLSSAPWGAGPLVLSGLTSGALQALERAAAAATEAGRRCLAVQLASALAAGRGAAALREAQAGSDAELLEGELRAARELGLAGLEEAEERLRQLEDAAEVAAATAEAESRLRELLTGSEEPSQSSVRDAAARLPAASALRALADATCEAMDARCAVAASAAEAVAGAAGVADAGDSRLQAALADAGTASARLAEALRDAGAACEAAEGVAASLDAALEAGECAAGLREAMQGSDRASLEDRVAQADRLGLLARGSQRDTVEERLSELRAHAAAAADAAAPRIGTDLSAERKWGEPADGCSNLIFIDLELTSGFYEFDRRPRILEAAVLVTDRDLRELDRGCWVVGGFTKEELAGLGEFHQAHFRDRLPGGPFPSLAGSPTGGNGLFADVLSSRTSMEEVEEAALSLIRRHCPRGACPLVGYSVQCDREVLKVEMPHVYRHLSHRIIDVSSFFHVARHWVPDRLRQWEGRVSRYNHRALNDVEESVEAMRFVRQHLFQKGAKRRGFGGSHPAGAALGTHARAEVA